MDKLSYIIPLVLIFIFILIHMALRNIKYSLIIFLTLPFALSGGVFYIETLGFNFSIAVIVGFMALLGVAAETSIVMMLYLDEAIKNMKTKSIEALKEAIYHGAVLRLRPKLMTLFAILGGLIPIMYISSIGSEVMQRVAAPMIGGMVSSAFLTLFVIPTIFYIVISKDLKLNKE
jgi:copper/silver efflux system protein